MSSVKNMNDEIVNTIEFMCNYTSTVTTRKQQPKPSSEEIYQYLLGKHHILIEDDFISAIQSLEADGIIYKLEGSKYYHVSYNYSYTHQNPTSSVQENITGSNLVKDGSRNYNDRNLIKQHDARKVTK